MDKRIENLEKGSIPRLLFSFAVPSIAATLVSSTYNIVDRIFVGRCVGEAALGGVTVAFPLLMLMAAFGMMIGHGSAALMSIKLGEKRKDQADLILTQALVLFGIIAIFFTIFGLYFLTDLLKLFGATDEILPYSKSYQTIIFFGSFFHLVSYGMNGQIRGEGNLKWAMITMIICASVNIVLDWLLIYVLGWGIQGAAFATITAQMFGAIWVLIYYISKRSTVRLRLAGVKLQLQRVFDVIKIGSPSCFMVFIGCILQGIILNRLKIFGGQAAISCMGAVFAIINVLVFSPLIGIGQGAQPIFGYSYGSKNTPRLLHTLRLSLITTTVLSLISFVAIMSFAKPLMSLFSNSTDDGVVIFGPEFLRIYVVALPVLGMLIITRIYFLAIGNYRLALAVSAFRQVVVLIPLLLILPKFLGVNGIWWSIPISDFIGAIFGAYLIFSEIKKLRMKQAVFEV